jgi:hypothetical protein
MKPAKSFYRVVAVRKFWKLVSARKNANEELPGHSDPRSRALYAARTNSLTSGAEQACWHSLQVIASQLVHTNSWDSQTAVPQSSHSEMATSPQQSALSSRWHSHQRSA